eukprot:TRINITY_DN25413_c0_g1_i1.p1 TRINITY_DN25413_c0_g1~~TRINITY_DN25413_c0_g1_i1.p1  ORF type:complete len:324 (-),score=59.82 TRINITY_DN25413_c0_g1_i1:38-976(-)
MQKTELCFFFHANGLCKEVLWPVVHELASALGLELCKDAARSSSSGRWRPDVATARLGSSLHVALVDLPGHGSAPHLALDGLAVDWNRFAQHVEAVVAECRAALPEAPSQITAFGHSLGGGCAVVAQLQAQRRLFDRIYLYEPMYFFHLLKPALSDNGASLLVQQTLRRRASWPSRAEAERSFLQKPFYKAWDARALDGYLQHALCGSGPVELSCAPATEAAIFAGGPELETLRGLQAVSGDGLKGSLLCVAMGKEATHGWTPPLAEQIFGAVAPAVQVSVVDGGHMWPLENPACTAVGVARAFGWKLHSRL